MPRKRSAVSKRKQPRRIRGANRTIPPGVSQAPVYAQPVAPPDSSDWFQPIRIPLALIAGAYGAYFWNGVHTQWLKGFPFQVLFVWLVWGAFSKRVHDPEPSGAEPTPVPVPVLPPGSRKQGKPLPAPSEAKDSRGASGILWAVLILVLAGSTSTLYGLDRFGPGLWVLMGTLALVAVVFRLRGEDRVSWRLASEKKWLWAVLAIAFLMRFPFLKMNFTSFQIDEANHLADGVRVMKWEITSPFATGWWGNPSMPYFFTAAWFKVFGVSLAVGRAMSAFYMMVAFVIFYRWSRLYFSAVASLSALGFMVVGWWVLFYSLSPFTDAITVMFEVLAFYLLETALRSGERWRYFWFGVVAAGSVMTYISGRLIPVILFLSVAGLLVFARGFRSVNRWKGLALSGLVFLWAISPFLLYLAHDTANLVGRAAQLSIFTEMNRSGDHRLVFKTCYWSAVSFLGITDSGFDPRFGLSGVAMTDMVTSALVLIGLGLTFVSLRSRATWMVLPGFIGGVIANGFAIQGPNPDPSYMNAQRFFFQVPFLYFMLARGMDWILALAGKAGESRALRRLGGLLLGAGWALSLALNAKVYYRDIQKDANCQESMSFFCAKYVEMYERLYPKYHFVVQWEAYQSNERFLLGDRVKLTVLDADKFKVPIMNPVNRDVLLMFPMWDWKGQAAEIKKIYPEAVWNDDFHEYHQSSMNIVAIPLAAIIRERHGKPPVGDPLP